MVEQQEPITRSLQLPYWAYVTAFLQTGLFLAFFPREIGDFRSKAARIGEYKMAASGGHVDRIKYAECTNYLSIFLFHSSLSSRFSLPRITCCLPQSFAVCTTLSTCREMEKIIDRSDSSSAKVGWSGSDCFVVFFFIKLYPFSDVVHVFYNAVKSFR